LRGVKTDSALKSALHTPLRCPQNPPEVGAFLSKTPPAQGPKTRALTRPKTRVPLVRAAAWPAHLPESPLKRSRHCHKSPAALPKENTEKAQTKPDGNEILHAPTPHITGSEKHSEKRAALFAVRVHVIVMQQNTH